MSFCSCELTCHHGGIGLLLSHIFSTDFIVGEMTPADLLLLSEVTLLYPFYCLLTRTSIPPRVFSAL